ncbi:MAG TPA: hypothetical protein VJJ46_07085 [Anaerolineales bacterium]|nr:hypothetical protein [Anaerolineales bacterium]
MKQDRGSLVPWFVVGLVAALLCCLCLVIAALGAAGVLTYEAIRIASTAYPTDIWETLVPTTPERPMGPTPTPLDGPEAVAPDARAMRQALAEEIVPVADLIGLVERLQGEGDVPQVVATSAEPIPVGTLETFWVQNEDTTEYFQVSARMVYARPHIYFWVQEGVDFDQGDVERLVDEFEDQIYPTDREFFGSEWTPGVDGDPHLYILFTRGLGSWVAGYFGSNDEYHPAVNEYSNSHEMFYINADGQSLADPYTYSTLAHEFQHMIHWSLDENEDSWVDEGFAELASFLNGYDTGGWDYAFAEDPDIPLTFWPSGDDSGVHYGQSFLFMTYFLDRFGREATQALAREQANGLDSVDRTLAALGMTEPGTAEPITGDDVFQDLAVALLLHDSSIGDGRFSLEEYPSAPSFRVRDRYVECPLAQPIQSEVNQYGIDLVGLSCGGDYTLQFQGSTMAQVVPAEAHSGDWAFWSNRGNQSDMTLTRELDLTGVSGPVEFSYWLWYDIEEDWDYVYLEASQDGGETWTILTTPSGTSTDPTGNSYGWGYTGFSGGGNEGVWIEESVNLTDYAGGRILLRFEYITDASVNGEGLLLDDLSISALDYTEDFEDDEGGWEGEGFIRLYNRLPQTYRVVVVEFGDETRISEMELDELNHAEMPLTLRDDTGQAVVLVIGTVRHTWRPAPYQIDLR